MSTQRAVDAGVADDQVVAHQPPSVSTASSKRSTASAGEQQHQQQPRLGGAQPAGRRHAQLAQRHHAARAAVDRVRAAARHARRGHHREPALDRRRDPALGAARARCRGRCPRARGRPRRWRRARSRSGAPRCRCRSGSTGTGGSASGSGTWKRRGGRTAIRTEPGTTIPTGPWPGEVNAWTREESCLRAQRAAWISSLSTSTVPSPGGGGGNLGGAQQVARPVGRHLGAVAHRAREHHVGLDGEVAEERGLLDRVGPVRDHHGTAGGRPPRDLEHRRRRHVPAVDVRDLLDLDRPEARHGGDQVLAR